MNAGIGCAGAIIVEEAEVAAFVGLGDLVLEEFSISARVVFFGRSPGSAALFQLVVADMEGDAAIGEVELYQVAIFDEREWSANRSFW